MTFIEKIKKYTFVTNQQERDEVERMIIDLQCLFSDLAKWEKALAEDGKNSKALVRAEIQIAREWFTKND